MTGPQHKFTTENNTAKTTTIPPTTNSSFIQMGGRSIVSSLLWLVRNVQKPVLFAYKLIRLIVVRSLIAMSKILWLRCAVSNMLYLSPRFRLWCIRAWKLFSSNINDSHSADEDKVHILLYNIKNNLHQVLLRIISTGWARHFTKSILHNHPVLWVKAARIQRQIMAGPLKPNLSPSANQYSELTEPADDILKKLQHRIAYLKADLNT